MSSETPIPKKLLIKPIIISNKKKMIIKSPTMLANIKFPVKPVQQYKVEVIYDSPNCDFLKGESQRVLIINRLNLITKTCQTIAKCTSSGKTVESTSDSVCSLIGQKNYETVLSALSSVFSEETKVRGILALLSAQKKITSSATQTEKNKCEPKNNLVDSSSQTVDTSINMFVKEKQRKRIRRQPLTPYVVMERPSKLKKLVINIDDVKKEFGVKKEELTEKTPSLPDLKLVVDEDSNMSCGSHLSLSSLPSVNGILDNPQEILCGIDKVTDKTLKPTGIPLRDGSVIMVPIKPEDDFHIATPDVLKNVTHEERLKLIWHQAFIDFRLCLEQNEDGFYPLHIAVLSNDADVVRRQCAALRARHESVDIPAGGLTALHMSVRQNVSTACTKILLQNGADPLLCDQERRCSLHLAAELETPQLQCLINYCDMNARSVLKNNLDFWRPEYEAKTDEQLKTYLYKCLSVMYDDQGYTPLMMAAEATIPSNVLVLASRAGSSVDAAAPNCGATALYRAVAKACLNAKETRNNITASDKILKTIEILVEHGADPAVENHSGSSVNSLLTEFNISALSMTIANKMTAMKHGRHSDNPNMILYKHNDGRIAYKDINNTNDNKMTKRNIPPNLHAIITIDIPKKEYKRKKCETKVKSNDDSKVSQNLNPKDGSTEGANSSKSVNTNQMKKEVKDVKGSGIKDLMPSAILKDVIKERNVNLNPKDGRIEDANCSVNTNEVKKDVKRSGIKDLILDNAILKDEIKGSKVNLNPKDGRTEDANSSKGVNTNEVKKEVKDVKRSGIKYLILDNAILKNEIRESNVNLNPKDGRTEDANSSKSVNTNEVKKEVKDVKRSGIKYLILDNAILKDEIKESNVNLNPKNGRTEDANSSKSVNTNEVKKQFEDLKRSGIKDLILNNAILKDAIKDRNVHLRKFSSDELNNFLAKANTSLEDETVDTNTNVQVKESEVFKEAQTEDKNTNIQVNLGNVLQQAQANLSITIKDGLIKKAKRTKILKKLGIKEGRDYKFAKNYAGKPMSAKKITALKLTNINNATISNDNFLIVKDTPPDNITKLVNSNNEINNMKLKDDNEVVKKNDIDGKTNETQASDAKMITNKNNELSDLNEQPTSSTKDGKREKVVIVENLALKRGFPIPNILKTGNRSFVKARDIVISPKIPVNDNISTNNDDVKNRKRKYE